MPAYMKFDGVDGNVVDRAPTAGSGNMVLGDGSVRFFEEDDRFDFTAPDNDDASIIGVLIGLLMPAVRPAEETPSRTIDDGRVDYDGPMSDDWGF